MRRKAFTLIEMLVVAAIIILLISIAAPALMRAKFIGRLTVCKQSQHQFAAALCAYANSYGGYYPGSPLSGTGLNLWDVPLDFYATLHTAFNLPHEFFFCIDTPEEDKGLVYPPSHFAKYNWFNQIGYLYWVQRGGSWPPDYSNVSPYNSQQVLLRGPRSMHDLPYLDNPLLTCFVGSFKYVAGASLDEDNPALQIELRSAHRYRGKVDGVNEAFYDGHVESFSHNELRCLYKSQNRYNWR